jgi:hypothetical protein
VRLFLPLAIAMAVLLAACGGGDDNEPASTGTPASPAGGTPAAAATVENRDEVEALLKAASLQQEDLPSGYTLDEEGFTTNEEAVGETSDPGEPTLEDLNEFGRILGYNTSYSDLEKSLNALGEDGGTLSIDATTTLYDDSDGADDAFEFVRDQVNDQEFLETYKESTEIPGVEITDATISQMSIAELGDKRLAIEVKVSAHSTDLDQDFDFIAQVVGIRRDRIIGSITVLAITAPSPGDELEDLARTLDGRMKDALE